MKTALDWLMGAFVVACLASIASLKQSQPASLPWLKQDRCSHLGAENDAIARAVYSGRGFSDPFGTESGPTAWRPPALVYLTSFAYWITNGDRDSVVKIFTLLQLLALVVVAGMVLCQARRVRQLAIGYTVLITGFSANFHELFQKTDDTALLTLLICGLWIGLVRMWKKPSNAVHAIAWGVFGGVSALSSPVVGATWFGLTLTRWIQRNNSKCNALLIATFSFALVVTPWVIRNRIVLEAWIPIKSNAMYELWQSQCQGDSGLLSDESQAKHPWNSYGDHRNKYMESGELQFVRQKGSEAIASIYSDPLDFLRRVKNRATAATVYYSPYSDAEYKLGNGWPIFFKRIVLPIPTVCVLVSLLLHRHVTVDPTLWAAIGIWGISLAPFAIISYYDRYAAPLIGVKMLIVVFTINNITARLRKRHISC